MYVGRGVEVELEREKKIWKRGDAAGEDGREEKEGRLEDGGLGGWGPDHNSDPLC